MDWLWLLTLVVGGGGVVATWDLLRSRPFRRLEFLRDSMGKDTASPASLELLHEALFLKNYRTAFFFAPRGWLGAAAFCLSLLALVLWGILLAYPFEPEDVPLGPLSIGFQALFLSFFSIVLWSAFSQAGKALPHARLVQWMKAREALLMLQHMQVVERETPSLEAAVAKARLCDRPECGHPRLGGMGKGHGTARTRGLVRPAGDGPCLVKGCACPAFVPPEVKPLPGRFADASAEAAAPPPS